MGVAAAAATALAGDNTGDSASEPGIIRPLSDASRNSMWCRAGGMGASDDRGGLPPATGESPRGDGGSGGVAGGGGGGGGGAATAAGGGGAAAAAGGSGGATLRVAASAALAADGVRCEGSPSVLEPKGRRWK